MRRGDFRSPRAVGGRWNVVCGVRAPNVSFPRKRESSSFVDPRDRGDDGWLRRYAACNRPLLFPRVCFGQPTRTRGFEAESRPDASGRYACWETPDDCHPEESHLGGRRRIPAFARYTELPGFFAQLTLGGMTKILRLRLGMTANGLRMTAPASFSATCQAGLECYHEPQGTQATGLLDSVLNACCHQSSSLLSRLRLEVLRQ